MDKKAMLGKLAEFIGWFDGLTNSALHYICGPLIDFLIRLGGKDGEALLEKFKLFLRGELVEPQAAELPPARTAAEKRCVFFQNWFKKLSIAAEVPLPTVKLRIVSGKEIRDRRKKGWMLFFWPGGGREMYCKIMSAMGQANYWTAQFPGMPDSPNDADQIAWDIQAQNPFWFWAEVQENCPRLKTPWNELMKKFPPDAKQHLLSLEEYALVFFAYREEAGKLIDIPTWCWLRTRFGSACALGAFCAGSRLFVSGFVSLVCPFGSVGGRLAEILK